MKISKNKIPWLQTRSLSQDEYYEFRKQAIFNCFKWDPQIEDIEVLSSFPLVLKESEWKNISQIAEKLTKEIFSAEEELFNSPHLYKEIGLPWLIRWTLNRNKHLGMSLGAARVIRFDFHWTTDGWVISEANTDVPGGFNEASGISKLMIKYYPDYKLTGDPSHEIVKIISDKTNHIAAFVHATAYSDDRQVMEYLAGLCEGKNISTVFASPDNIKWDEGYAYYICGNDRQRVDFIFRFYPAEWLPNLTLKCDWKYYFCGSKIPICNPAYALLIQSKKLPVIWNKLKINMETWKKYLPDTFPGEKCKNFSKDEWVIKPVFGRVGENIGILGETDEKEMKKIQKDFKKHPKWYIIQKRFEPIPLIQNGNEYYPCIGVYTIDGKTSGAYGRIAKKKLIDFKAKELPIFISEDNKII